MLENNRLYHVEGCWQWLLERYIIFIIIIII